MHVVHIKLKLVQEQPGRLLFPGRGASFVEHMILGVVSRGTGNFCFSPATKAFKREPDLMTRFFYSQYNQYIVLWKVICYAASAEECPRVLFEALKYCPNAEFILKLMVCDMSAERI